MTNLSVSLMQKTIQRSNGRNMIAIVSGRGGGGKTCLAVTLAGLLAQQEKKVLLFDGDLGLANVDAQLKMAMQPDIESVLRTKIPMNKAVRHFERGGFDVITGRTNGHSLGAMDTGTLQVLRDDLLLLSTHYDFVILDLNCGMKNVCETFIKSAGVILVVCTDEVTALTDAYALIQKIVRMQSDKSIQIVINQAASLKEGERVYYTLAKACSDFFEFEPSLCGVIRYDKAFLEATEHHTPILNLYPDCDGVSDIKEVMKNIKNA